MQGEKTRGEVDMLLRTHRCAAFKFCLMSFQTVKSHALCIFLHMQSPSY